MSVLFVAGAGLLLGTGFFLLPWLFAALLGLAAVAAVVLARKPFFGVLLIAFLLPFERIGAWESPYGTIRPSQVVALLTLVVWLFQLLRHRDFSLRRHPLFIPLAIFLAVNVVGLTQALNPSYAVLVLLLTAFTLLVSGLVAQYVDAERRLVLLTRALLVSAAVVAVFGLFQFIGDAVGLPTNVTGLRPLYTKEIFGFPRIQSTALEPLYFANFLLLPLGLAYSLFLHTASPRWRWALFLLFGLLSVNLVLTVSRGGYAGFVVLLLLITVLSLRRLFRLQNFLPLIVGAAVVTLAVSQVLRFGDLQGVNTETFIRHVQDVFTGPSFAERVETLAAAQQAFWQSPWVGVGPGGFGPFVAVHPLVRPASGWLIVNNESLELLAETGLLGFLSMLAALALLFLRSLKVLLRGASGTAAAIHLGLLGALGGALTQYQTFSTLYIIHIWFLVGALVAAQNILLLSYADHS